MRILVTGASGRLGRYVLREARQRDLDVVAWSGRQTGEVFGYPLVPIQIEDAQEVSQRFRVAKSDAILHAAAFAKVNECYQNPARAWQVNVDATRTLAELATGKCPMVHVSTDMVFGGDRAPYREADPAAPLSEYGKSKAQAEKALAVWSEIAIARVSLLYGPSLGDQPMFFDQLLTTLHRGEPFKLFTDEYRTPLALTAAARALLDLAESNRHGTWHIGGPERLSRYEFGLRLAGSLGVPKELVQPVSRLESPTAEPRPADLSLESEKFKATFPRWRTESVEESLREMGIGRQQRVRRHDP